MRELLLKPGASLEGESYSVVIDYVSSKRINLDKARRLLTPQMLAKLTEEVVTPYVRVREKAETG